MDIDTSKYDISVIESLDTNNITRIIQFLEDKGCDYISDLLDDYLDIFTFKYEDFVDKFNKINLKYNNNLIAEIKNDTNILEEFYF